MMRNKYKLVCTSCAKVFEDDGYVLDCPNSHGPALLRTVYVSRNLECEEGSEGIYRYNCWLPTVHRLSKPSSVATFRSERLAVSVGLPNLWITFSGYWPKRGARLATGTFKELEAYGVLSRIPIPRLRIPVIASAGNTAAAFARACSRNRRPCLLIVPKDGMERMVFSSRLKTSVKIVCLTGGADYSDAIALAEAVAKKPGFFLEGGVRNVGRRDGMATALLHAVETVGHLPDYYFQAIGSGAGAIAAHEGAKRLVEDGRFGSKVPRLMLSQNSPFTPIHDSWKRGKREFIDLENGDDTRTRAKAILAMVLSNRRPPYSIPGGVFDVLTESHGDMFAVENAEVREAMELFDTCEGVDIDPAAAVALAALIKAVALRRIERDATVLLHITGGGFRLRTEARMVAALPDLEISFAELGSSSVVERISGLFLEEPTSLRGRPARESVGSSSYSA